MSAHRSNVSSPSPSPSTSSSLASSSSCSSSSSATSSESVTSTSTNSNVKSALSLEKQLRWRAAFSYWETACTNNEDESGLAEFRTGNRYYFGDGLTKNLSAAKVLWTKSAKKGHEGGLAGCYFVGCGGFPEDEKLAIDLYKNLAQSDSDAQFRLGILYRSGIGVPKDPRQAAKWLRAAADQGHSTAQFNLAGLYQIGNGVSKDLQKAAQYFQLAAEQGDPLAQMNLAVCYGRGDGVVASGKQALHWCTVAAEQGLEIAQFRVAEIYETGEGVTPDILKAVKWYQRVADQQPSSSHGRSLGQLYADGSMRVAKNENQAAEWFDTASLQRQASAQIRLSMHYGRGYGNVLPKDVVKAAELRQRADETLDKLCNAMQGSQNPPSK